MSGVKNTALFERLMEIHSNSPKLYYGFNVNLFYVDNNHLQFQCSAYLILDSILKSIIHYSYQKEVQICMSITFFIREYDIIMLFFFSISFILLLIHPKLKLVCIFAYMFERVVFIFTCDLL